MQLEPMLCRDLQEFHPHKALIPSFDSCIHALVQKAQDCIANSDVSRKRKRVSLDMPPALPPALSPLIQLPDGLVPTPSLASAQTNESDQFGYLLGQGLMQHMIPEVSKSKD